MIYSLSFGNVSSSKELKVYDSIASLAVSSIGFILKGIEREIDAQKSNGPLT